MRKSVLVALSITLFMMSSCTSFLDFQSGRALGKGNTELTVSATSANLKNDEDQSNPFVSPSIELRRGLTDKFDLGIQSQPFSAVGLNGKYQFVGDLKSNLAVAGFFKLGYDYTISDDLTFADTEGYYGYYSPGGILDTVALEYDLFRTEIGVVGSYRLGKELALTASLKGIYYSNFIADTHTIVNTYGLEAGKKTKFVFNVGYNIAWAETNKQQGFAFGRWQYGIGVRKPINFKSKKEDPKTLQGR